MRGEKTAWVLHERTEEVQRSRL